METIDKTFEKIATLNDKVGQIGRALDERDTDDLDAISQELNELRAWLQEATPKIERAPQATKLVPTWVWIIGVVIALLFLLRD